MFVYVLFVTTIAFVPGEIDIQVRGKALNVFPTPEECQIELERITKDMVASYPGHTDYRLTCEKKEKPVTQEKMF